MERLTDEGPYADVIGDVFSGSNILFMQEVISWQEVLGKMSNRMKHI